jgi:hypothetical protein
VRNPVLHGLLHEFAADSALRLGRATAEGEQVPFEVVETDPRARIPLYCYRPLTCSFIRDRLGLLVTLPSYAPAAQALEQVDTLEAYLRARGESRVPDRPRERADTALRLFLFRLFEDRDEFDLDDARLATAYDELERSLYDGRCLFEVAAPLLGMALDRGTDELELGEGLVIVRRDKLRNPPDEASVALASSAETGSELLIVMRALSDRAERPPVSQARSRFRRVLTALRLFERGRYALGPLAWTRIDAGPWRPVALGTSGRAGLPTPLPAEREDELRAFCNLIARRLPGRSADSSGAGELAWALARYEMGCERFAPFEALTDHLLALRALLEPEGPSSGRLAGRLAVICAAPQERGALAERVAHAISLERAVIAGLAPAAYGPAQPAGRLIDEIGDHLRAILRDVLCGHLDTDLRALADDLLGEAAALAV